MENNFFIDSDNLSEAALAKKDIPYEKEKNRLVFHTENASAALAILSECKESIVDFEVKRGTLNEVFLAITGKEIRE